jgi:dephospho-CoA kinase
MKYLFITGTPASGKSTLAKKFALAKGWAHFDIDDWREEMWQDPDIRPWVDFFINKDEAEYWKNTSPEGDFKNLIDQSEAFWPTILRKIKEVMVEGKPAVFEAVNILPHLAKRDLPFEGVVLINDQPEVIFERIKAHPRWGKTEELQHIEARRFADEARFYKSEAKKYGYKVFSDSKEAEEYLIYNF